MARPPMPFYPNVPTTPFTRYTGEGDVLGDCVAENRGADCVSD